jgi:hypothetical protein
MKTVVITLTLATVLVSRLWAQNPLSFKVAVHSTDGVVLLVPANATDSDLAKLLNALRTARKGGSLGTFFPPTTPGGSRGPYAAVQVFVMSDATWATAPRLKAFMKPPTSSISAAEKDFARRVRAYYLYPLTGQEFGSVGYEDQDIRYKTPNYKRLF